MEQRHLNSLRKRLSDLLVYFVPLPDALLTVFEWNLRLAGSGSLPRRLSIRWALLLARKVFFRHQRCIPLIAPWRLVCKNHMLQMGFLLGRQDCLPLSKVHTLHSTPAVSHRKIPTINGLCCWSEGLRIIECSACHSQRICTAFFWPFLTVHQGFPSRTHLRISNQSFFLTRSPQREHTRAQMVKDCEMFSLSILSASHLNKSILVLR